MAEVPSLMFRISLMSFFHLLFGILGVLVLVYMYQGERMVEVLHGQED